MKVLTMKQGLVSTLKLETKLGDAYNHVEQNEKVDAEKFDITKVRKEKWQKTSQMKSQGSLVELVVCGRILYKLDWVEQTHFNKGKHLVSQIRHLQSKATKTISAKSKTNKK